MTARKLRATLTKGVIISVAALFISGAHAEEGLNEPNLNGLAINGLSLNGLPLINGAENNVITLQFRETKSARMWESIKKLSKQALGQKKGM